MFRWDPEKNRVLLQTRGITFDEVIQAIADGHAVSDVAHWNQKKYPKQRILTVIVRGYAYLVPYVSDGDGYFLKTIIPSRKAWKHHTGGTDGEADN